MICAVLVIVPGDGVAWCQCKNPRQDIAAFQHRLDVFDFVRIGCGHNDVLPINFQTDISVYFTAAGVTLWRCPLWVRSGHSTAGSVASTLTIPNLSIVLSSYPHEGGQLG